MIYPLATALVALVLAGLLLRSQARTLDLYRAELRTVAEERAAATASASHLAGEFDAAEARHARDMEAAAARETQLHADLRTAREAANVERQQLLDRIQRPETVPYSPADLDIGDRKLHHNEYDELQGITPAEVAARAGAEAMAEHLSPYIDEIAVAEGVTA